MVTKRIRPLRGRRQAPSTKSGSPSTGAFVGRTKGPLINNLTPSVLDPNSGTPEYKGFLVNMEKV